jgi:quercetin dioxygenase-like cupin family protein
MKVAICFAIAVAAGAAADQTAPPAPKPKPPSTEELLGADLASAKWMPAAAPGIPPGAQLALIGVDPASGGATGYAKFPAGYHLPLHWHSHAEYATLLSGSGSLTADGKQFALSPGTYVVIPAKVQHELRCAAGAECVLLTRRAGPTDYNFVGR